MRETTYALTPLMATMYFTIYPSDFFVVAYWLANLLR
jgi:hypothetical protein